MDRHLVVDDRVLSFAEVVRDLQRDPALRDQLTAAIARAPYPALFWECAPVAPDTRDTGFSFVLVDSPGLARVSPEPGAFASHYTDSPVATFPNLGGDAVLVAPRPLTPDAGYPHLAAFLRSAPPSQVHALWIAVGAAVERWWEERAAPLWVSTSGLGVYWLHVRLDSRPKYYTHAPYRLEP